jgi:molybdopterin molybdotransferase
MPLLSYLEAAEQVQRYIAALAVGESPAGAAKTVAPETVALEASLGRVLAEPVRADRDQPPFPRATRDGYACRAIDANANEFLAVGGHVRAGEIPASDLAPGEMWEIMTGAPVPAGADAVIMVEHTETAQGLVRLVAPRLVDPGENIVPQGAEARAGDLLVPPGVRITPSQVAIAAQCGYSRLQVVPRTRVAILATGDELVPVASTPGPGQIRNSNSAMLAALVAEAGGMPVILPRALDEEAAVKAALELALSEKTGADLLLISGGISAGRFDFVEGGLTALGARFFFGGVAMQPGKPLVFGQLPRGASAPLPFFGLPGNPISSAVTFHLFAAPLLAALGDDASPRPRFGLAELAGEWKGKAGLTRFLPAHCDFGLRPRVRLVTWQGSGDLAAFAISNCCVVVPEESSALTEGSIVSILLT